MVSSTHFWIGPWRVDPELNTISNAGRVTTVEPRAMRTLCYLHQNQGHPVSRDELLDKVWGKQALTDHAISVVIVSLRQALEDDAQNPKYLKTIRKKGYCLIAEEETTGGAPEGHLYARPVQKKLYSKRNRTVLGVLAVMTISALLIAVAVMQISLQKAGRLVILFNPIEQTEAASAALSTVANDLLLMELARYGRVVPPSLAHQVDPQNLYTVSVSSLEESGEITLSVLTKNFENVSENMTTRSETGIAAMASSVRSLVSDMMAGHPVVAPKSKSSSDIEVILDRARYFWGFHRLDRNKLAYRMVRNLLLEYPSNGDVHALLAEMYAALPGHMWGLDGVDTLELAEQHIQRAAELGASAKYIWRTRARIIQERGQDYFQAAKLYQKALDHDPEDYWNWRNLAVSYAVGERFEEALEAHDKAIALSLEPTGALTEKMITLYFSGQFKAAAELKRDLHGLDGRPSIRSALIHYMADEHDASFAEWAQYFDRQRLPEVAGIFRDAQGTASVESVYTQVAAILANLPKGQLPKHLEAYLLFAANDVEGGSQVIEEVLAAATQRKGQPDYDPRSNRIFMFMRIDPFIKRHENNQLVYDLLHAMKTQRG